MVQEIIPGIYTSNQRVANGKTGIIFGEKKVLAVDTGIDLAEGQTMADFIREQGHDPNWLLYTHGHGDHVLGSAPFRGTEVIAHNLTPVEIQRLMPDSIDVIVWPTLTFSDEMRIDLGGKHARLFSTPGHSQDSISVYVEEDRVLFAGDSIVTTILPVVDAGDSRELEATLRNFMAMDIDIVVPGHGEVLQGTEQIHEVLEWSVTYLNNVRDAVRDALNRGVPHDDIVETVEDFDKFVGDRLPKDRNFMPKRHRNTIIKLLKEETE